MDPVALAAAAVAAVLGPVTAVGAWRRGQRRTGLVFSGLFFPISWAVWYVHDRGDWADSAEAAENRG